MGPIFGGGTKQIQKIMVILGNFPCKKALFGLGNIMTPDGRSHPGVMSFGRQKPLFMFESMKVVLVVFLGN